MKKEQITKKMLDKYLGSGWNINFEKETSVSYQFMCRTKNQNSIPNAMAIAVNKKSGKVGKSIISFEEAEDACMK